MNIISYIISIFFGKRVKQICNQRAGFTLVESMVAISILSMAITGPLLIAQKGIGSAIYAREQTTAFYLAQEAVEYVRNIRDSNRINNLDWLSGLGNCTAGTCSIDTTVLIGSGITSCPSNICPPLQLSTSNGLYGHTVDQTSAFTRSIVITESPADVSAKIAVTISWSTKLFAPVRSFTIQEYIFNF